MLLSCGVLVYTTGCKEEKKEVEEQIKLVATSPLQKDTTITKEYVAQVHSYQRIELRALEKGYLEKIFVDEGQHVSAGQTMFQIKPTVYQAELKKSQAEAHYVQMEYQNTKKLADKNIVSGSELALAQAKFDKANADVSLAQTHLQFTTVKAPFSGIMDHFQGRLGSLVDEGDLLTTLSDNSKMWVYYNVPEAEYLAYKAHAKANDKAAHVKLLMANNEVFNQTGVVQTIEADFNNETGNIAFRATFPNPEGLLRNGETGSVLMTVPLQHALIIPQKATFEILEKEVRLRHRQKQRGAPARGEHRLGNARPLRHQIRHRPHRPHPARRPAQGEGRRQSKIRLQGPAGGDFALAGVQRVGH